MLIRTTGLVMLIRTTGLAERPSAMDCSCSRTRREQVVPGTKVIKKPLPRPAPHLPASCSAATYLRTYLRTGSGLGDGHGSYIQTGRRGREHASCGASDRVARPLAPARLSDVESDLRVRASRVALDVKSRIRGQFLVQSDLRVRVTPSGARGDRRRTFSGGVRSETYV